jgi:hypothetical protein
MTPTAGAAGGGAAEAVFSVRKSTVLAMVLAVVYATAGMGRGIFSGGKLAVSDLTPLAFIAVAALFFFSRRRTVEARIIWFILLFNLSCALSFAIFLIKYQWVPNFPVLLFEDVELTFCILLWWFGSQEPQAFHAAVKWGILCSLPISVLYWVHDLHSGAPWFTAGMDDKSQGAVLLCCQAYVLIRFFGTKLRRLTGAGLYVASFLTISRLPVFFFPAMFLGLLRRSRFAAFVTLVATAAAVYMLVVAGKAVQETFVVYNRLSSMQVITGSDSTEAHLLLLKTALQIKFTEPLAFVFGTGPDNFSKALATVPDAMGKLESLDPQLVSFALLGKAPLHSTPMQMLLDYNIGIFLLFVFFLVRTFRYLLRRANLTDLAFACGLFLASCFYSLHNKPYFYLYVVTIALLIVSESSASADLNQRIRTGAKRP